MEEEVKGGPRRSTSLRQDGSASAPLPESFFLFVKAPSMGKKYRIVAEGSIANLRVRKIKQHLALVTRVLPENQAVSFEGGELCDEACCGTYGIESGDTLTMTTVRNCETSPESTREPSLVSSGGDGGSFLRAAVSVVAEEAGSHGNAPIFVAIRSRFHSLDEAIRVVGAGDGVRTNTSPVVINTSLGAIIFPPDGSDASTTTPHDRILHLQQQNSLLRAQVEDLEEKLQQVEDFKEDVLGTIRTLKKEVCNISEDIILGYPS